MQQPGFDQRNQYEGTIPIQTESLAEKFYVFESKIQPEAKGRYLLADEVLNTQIQSITTQGKDTYVNVATKNLHADTYTGSITFRIRDNLARVYDYQNVSELETLMRSHKKAPMKLLKDVA